MTTQTYTDEQVRELFEMALTRAIAADPLDAPFPLSQEQASIWHQARASAFQWVLEMLPSETDRQRLQAEVEALRPDAERYRWIRNEADPDMDEPYITRHVCGKWGKWRNTWETGSTADECIDAARATPNETKEAKS